MTFREMFTATYWLITIIDATPIWLPLAVGMAALIGAATALQRRADRRREDRTQTQMRAAAIRAEHRVDPDAHDIPEQEWARHLLHTIRELPAREET